MTNPLAAHPPWRRLLIVAVVLPVMIVLAVLAFAWPAARIAPRGLPIGVVGAPSAAQSVVGGLAKMQPGAFDVHRYSTLASARAAIRDRTVYGAFDPTGDGLTVLEASAASPSVAQLLTTAGQQLAIQTSGAPTSGVEPRPPVQVVDVVPTSSADPRGLVMSSALLPLTICSIIIAVAIGLVAGLRPAWRQIVGLIVTCTLAGLGAYLIAQGFLGALPHEPVATAAALALTLLAISASTAGLIALIGAPGFTVGAILMVFMGNPFSGATSAPQLLPDWVDHLGQWLPPGAGLSLLRGTAYFGGHGAASHLIVLSLWTVSGLTAITLGHHTWTGFAAHPSRFRSDQPAEPGDETPAGVASPGCPKPAVSVG